MTSAETTATASALASRLDRLESAQAVRTVLARYMLLCDQPCADRNFPQLPDLFADGAVWEGVGRHYEGSFGRHQGRAAIVAFVASYLAPSPHFARNLHFLTSDQVSVADDGATARGQWLMLQLSTYGGGGSEAITARLDVDFQRAGDGSWRIAHFRTERLECMPWGVGKEASA
ncbi:polyketide cyclase [Massilia sp. Root418]|uniref:nuclear transport factor 2 family protein n=1 Tax=Massilia sp. Root418 TaxID=1736532 RepID=UPI0006F9E85D|nr:nuclear transport factor 2 family protein [Massilia sp. Root418]KQX01662.1 polyketide cyclase [Massilia sp. Root418]